MKQSIDLDSLALACKALGDPTRLKILRALSQCHSEVEVDADGTARELIGQTAGEVCCIVTGDSKINSHISHHLKELRNAGLINMQKKGRSVICSLNVAKISFLREFMQDLDPSAECAPEKVQAH